MCIYIHIHVYIVIMSYHMYIYIHMCALYILYESMKDDSGTPLKFWTVAAKKETRLALFHSVDSSSSNATEKT